MKSKKIKMYKQEHCTNFSIAASIAVPERAEIVMVCLQLVIGQFLTVLHC